MLMSTVTIGIAILAYTNGLGYSQEGGLLGVSLDIAVLLALSGADARRYTLERRAWASTHHRVKARRLARTK